MMLNIFHIFIGHMYFENDLFNALDHLLIGLFVLLPFNFLNTLYILDINLLLDGYLAKFFLRLSLLSGNCLPCRDF
jgi:hypothetical protein